MAQNSRKKTNTHTHWGKHTYKSAALASGIQLHNCGCFSHTAMITFIVAEFSPFFFTFISETLFTCTEYETTVCWEPNKIKTNGNILAFKTQERGRMGFTNFKLSHLSSVACLFTIGIRWLDTAGRLHHISGHSKRRGIRAVLTNTS
jgi:hypothetical protein